jgi:ABC-2 type transport system permease protein
MLGTIARKEFTEMTRDGRFRWAAVAAALLLGVALVAGASSWRAQQAQQVQATAQMREFWVNQGPKNPHSAAHYGTWAFKPKLTLAYVDQGVDPYTGVAAYLEAHKQNAFRFRPAADASAVQRLGDWTAAGVLQVLVPLLVIVAGFGAFASEREQGTLRQLAALGVPARTLMLGKAAGMGGALALVLVPAAVLGAIALVLAAGGPALVADLPRVAALAATYLAYFGIVAAVTLTVSAWARTARGALVTLLLAWAGTTLVLPRIAAVVAAQAHPVVAPQEFAARISRDLAEGIDEAALERRTLSQYAVATVAELPVNYDAIRMQAGEEHGNEVFDRHFGALYDTYRAQATIHAAFGAISPVLAVRALSMAIAGTNVEQHRAFAEAAESYRRLLVKAMNEDQAQHSRTGDWDYQAPPELWASLPPFDYEAPSVGTALRGEATALAVLGAWLAIAAWSIGRARRLEVA